MANTKQKIRDASRRLFNDKGYNQVTIRMIAIALEMSSGNLNYHYRKREDILKALYFEMVEEFDSRVKDLPKATISLAYIKTNIESSMERMIEYRFFWTDLYHILKSNDEIQAHFATAKSKRIAGYKFLLNHLQEIQMLEPPSFQDEYHFLSNRMIDYSNTWLYASSLYDISAGKVKMIGEASFQLMSMLYPYLTDNGQAEYRAMYTLAS